MGQLRYLMEEICAGIEIYYTGRMGGQYLKTAYILCDDYTELTSKLFLLTDDPNWSDLSSPRRFKNYRAVQSDVRSVIRAKRPADLLSVEGFHASMAVRRDRRNEFFHSTRLLDLGLTAPRCVEAFCDLLDYGGLLFSGEWPVAVSAARNLETLEVLLRLEKKAISDPAVLPRMTEILQDWPRNHSIKRKKGVHLAIHPEDLHLRLCVTSGGKELRDKLKALL